jgi:hypothetical protein
MERTYNSVSKYQFPMLRLFCERQTPLPLADAAKLDQRSFGSLYHRGWLGYKAGKGFYATDQGWAAFEEYVNTEARLRKRPELPLSHYFDPSIYQTGQEPKGTRRAAGGGG